MTIRAAILGPTGYTGLFLIQQLLRHPSASITYLASHRDELPDITEVFPQLLGLVSEKVALCRPIDPDAIAREADVVFLCLPHRAAMAYVPTLLSAGVRIIDLSADYRLRDPAVYEAAYGNAHEDTENLDDAVYGLPELYRDEIPEAALIANPGCYPTAAALGILPLLRREIVQPQGIIINAGSGTTGAGKNPAPHLHYPEMNESYYPYGSIGGHRHQPEIEQTLTTAGNDDVSVLFVPHMLPIDRGILETIYLDPVLEDITEDELFDAFEEDYANEPFVRLRSELPNVKHVRDTNFCDVTVRLIPGDDTRDAKIIVFSVIDNMIKGASGQAVQNMNLMFAQPETAGLL